MKDYMARIYYGRIKHNIMTIDEVPKRWRATVEKMLEEDERNSEDIGE